MNSNVLLLFPQSLGHPPPTLYQLSKASKSKLFRILFAGVFLLTFNVLHFENDPFILSANTES